MNDWFAIVVTYESWHGQTKTEEITCRVGYTAWTDKEYKKVACSELGIGEGNIKSITTKSLY